MAEDSSIASGNHPGIPYQGAALALERGSPANRIELNGQISEPSMCVIQLSG
jgi:hypothetical protein